MRDTLYHRGPDAAGEKCFESDRVAVGHRRLSILDLSAAGTQPFVVDDAGLTMVFNGEIYNFMELRSNLEGRGYVFHTGTDTEVLVRAYQEWGAAAVPRLEGMFAFVVYCKREKTFFCARDRSGEKPLFYFKSSHTFAFASEIKALLALPECPRTLNYEGLQQYLAFGYTIGSTCMVDGIQKLPPAHTLTYSVASGEVQLERYWGPPEFRSVEPRDSMYYSEELHGLLQASVKKQLVADVPVGILLSGGVDSSIVAAVAAEITPKPLQTFTAVFPGAGAFDESQYAKRVSEAVGSIHTELVVEPGSVELLSQLAYQFDDPIGDSSMIPTFLVSKMIREHATVALGGDGADELFGGYPYHRWLAQLEAYRRVLPLAVRAALLAMCYKGIPVGTRGRSYLLAALHEPIVAQSRFNLYFDPLIQPLILKNDLSAQLSGANRKALFDRTMLHHSTVTPDVNPPRLDFVTYLPDDILTKVDRASMLASLEIRAPWLDPAVIDFSFKNVPLNLKYSRTGVKKVPKVLAAKLLPDTVDVNRKQGFSLPLDMWFRGQWGEFMRATLIDDERSPFAPKAVEMLLRRQAAGASNMQRLFALTMFALWARSHRIDIA